MKAYVSDLAGVLKAIKADQTSLQLQNEFFEKAQHPLDTNTAIDLANAFPSGAHVAEVDGEVAAMALWFLNFSTWDGVEGVYLEDLYVRSQFRRLGLARGLLTALARECVDNGYTRLSWAVLDWNTDAMALYDAIGGQPQSEWITYRLSGPELMELAAPRL